MSWGGIGTLEGTLFLTFIFNEPTPFHTVAICTAASIVRQRYIALECQSHILYQHLAQCGSSQSQPSASNTSSYTTHSCYEPIFWTFGDASRNLFPPFIIRLFEAMSHRWAARGACRLWWDLLSCCNVGMIGGVERKTLFLTSVAKTAMHDCTMLSRFWLMLVHFVVWFQNQISCSFSCLF